MKPAIIIIGVGEMGGVFARGFLRLGHPVYPLRREDDLQQLAVEIPRPEAVLVAVGENELQSVLRQCPRTWGDHLVLLQNELLPADYAQFPQATVISVWFEKKPGRDYKVIIPSPAFGPKANLLADALSTLGIPVKLLQSQQELLFELVLKNTYILSTNIAGLKVGGSVGELWQNHRELAQQIIDDVIQLQETLTGQSFDHLALIQALLRAFEGDPEHQCRGRSASARLQRTLEYGKQNGLELPALVQIAAEMH